MFSHDHLRKYKGEGERGRGGEGRRAHLSFLLKMANGLTTVSSYSFPYLFSRSSLMRLPLFSPRSTSFDLIWQH